MIKPQLFRRKGLTTAIQVTGTKSNVEAIADFTGHACYFYEDTNQVSIQTDPALYVNVGDYIMPCPFYNDRKSKGFMPMSEEEFKDTFIVEA